MGAVVASDGTTRPAAWTSTDGEAWQALPLTAHTPYGEVAVLYSAGCRGGVLAAIGAQSGGVHGNPRVTQWRRQADGTLDEVLAPFELYGGPDAVNVGRVTGGPAGWLITGNRAQGAAVWTSPDATAFRLTLPDTTKDNTTTDDTTTDDTTTDLATEAADSVPYHGQWVVVGGGRRAGRTDSDPVVWTSADGRTWQRTALPDDGGHQVMQRAAVLDDTVIAVGVDGDSFRAWTYKDTWISKGRFGKLVPGGIQQIINTATTEQALWAAGTDGKTYGLWTSPDGGGWRAVRTPVDLAAAGADQVMTVAAAGGAVLLVADDGRRGRAWLANSE